MLSSRYIRGGIPLREPGTPWTFRVTEHLAMSAFAPGLPFPLPSYLGLLHQHPRAFGRSTILENNIVQTTGSAGESLAAASCFTIPALIFLGFGSEFTFWRISARAPGAAGRPVLVPLRRQLNRQGTWESGVSPRDCVPPMCLSQGNAGARLQTRLLGARPWRRLHLSMNTCRPGRPSPKPGQLVSRCFLPRGHHFGISRRRLHHRPAGLRHSVAGGIISWLVMCRH